MAERRPSRRALIAALIYLVIVAGGGAFIFIGCNNFFEGWCGNEVLRTVPSPDGKVKAVLFERDCGATTDFSEQVSLLAAEVTLPKAAGNTFDADSDHGAAPGGPQVKIVWQSNDRLFITHNPKARVYFARKKVRVGLGLFRSRWVTIVYNKYKHDVQIMENCRLTRNDTTHECRRFLLYNNLPGAPVSSAIRPHIRDGFGQEE